MIRVSGELSACFSWDDLLNAQGSALEFRIRILYFLFLWTESLNGLAMIALEHGIGDFVKHFVSCFTASLFVPSRYPSVSYSTNVSFS